MRTPDPLDLAKAEKITLARKEYSILPTVARQNRVIVPAIMDLFSIFISAKVAIDSGNPLGLKITSETWDRLVEILWVGLQRAHPELKREDVDEMEIGLMDLMKAVIIVAKQAGMMPEKRDGAGPLPSAILTTNGPIGIESLPKLSPTPDGNGTTSSTPSPLSA